MTTTQLEERANKSAVIVERLVRIQLRAMGCDHFEIGIKHDGGEMILREGQGAVEIEKTIKWFAPRERRRRSHLCSARAGTHSLSLCWMTFRWKSSCE
jgi:hypothetical protein